MHIYLCVTPHYIYICVHIAYDVSRRSLAKDATLDFASLLRALESEASVRWQAEPMAKLMMAIEGQERGLLDTSKYIYVCIVYLYIRIHYIDVRVYYIN